MKKVWKQEFPTFHYTRSWTKNNRNSQEFANDFSLEALKLFEKESYFAGGLYVVLSVVCCLVGVFCGRKLALAVL
ncbi:MAG: hypothetical protein IJL92_05710 [Thermoguttaceae bacterium]|nr:hypothetical protein [Thermoguttaceae bacterium]